MFFLISFIVSFEEISKFSPELVNILNFFSLCISILKIYLALTIEQHKSHILVLSFSNSRATQPNENEILFICLNLMLAQDTFLE